MARAIYFNFIWALDTAATTNDSKLCLLFMYQVNGFSLLFYFLIIFNLTMHSLTYHLRDVF